MGKGSFWPSQNNRPRDLDSRAAQAPRQGSKKTGLPASFPTVCNVLERFVGVECDLLERLAGVEGSCSSR